MDASEVATFLSSLSPEEQAVIRPVLERDLEFQRREKQRVRLLKTSVDLSKSDIFTRLESSMKDSASSESVHSNASGNSIPLSSSACPSSTASAATSPGIRACTQCGHKLGFLFNSGTKCKKCCQLICDGCRVYTTKEKNFWTCPVCFKEREFLAASGEWMSSETPAGPAPVSELLLSQLSRLAMDKRNERRTSEAGHNSASTRVRAPPMRSRNLTLPSIHHDNFLFVPSGNQHVIVTDSSPLGSPCLSTSPSPKNSTVNQPQGLMPAICPREVIGSPAPRAAPSFPMSPVGPPSNPLPACIPEDSVPQDNDDSPLIAPMDMRSRRQSWHTANRIRYETPTSNRRQSVQIPKIVF